MAQQIQAEIVQARPDFEATLPETATVLRYAQMHDGHGGRTERWVVDLVPMPLRFEEMTPAQPVILGERFADSTLTLHISYPTTFNLNVRDRLVLSNGRTYEVQGSKSITTWELLQQAWVIAVFSPYTVVVDSLDTVVGAATRQEWGFAHPGEATIEVGQTRFPVAGAWTVLYVLATCGTVANAPLVFDVLRNGTTIFTTVGNRPTIATGQHFVKSAAPDLPLLADGDYLTVNTLGTGGAGAPGADLVITVVVQPIS